MILVTGSLAYDYILSHDQEFQKSILPDDLDHLSVCFLAQELHKYRGGTAGNIAYNLKLLGVDSLLMATAGNDFESYAEDFTKLGISLDEVTVLDDVMTASAFITSDPKGNQITVFYPGAMGKAAKKSLEPFSIDIAIIAPEIPSTVLHYVEECKKHTIPYLFDPGQNITMFSKEDFVEGVTGAKGLIVNDYEWSVFQKTTGFSEEDVLAKAELLIVTHGGKGSTIRNSDETFEIPTVPTDTVKDPTGCGDAYRAGLLKGLAEGKSLEECGRMGAELGKACVEFFGTQEHTIGISSA